MIGYDPRTIKRNSDTNLIISRFLAASCDQRNIQLVNIYKGIPITHEATVIKAINDRLTVKYHKNHSLCLNLEGNTYIQSALFPKMIKAKVITINSTECVAILTDLTFSDPGFQKRKSPWVYLDFDDVTIVTISSPQSHVKLFGKLNDISLNGIGIVVIAIEDVMSRAFSKNASVEVLFSLPDSGMTSVRDFRIKGEIKYIARDGEHYKLGIQTFPDSQAEEVIRQFITRRQAEILEEVEKYNTMFDSGNWRFPTQA